MKNYEQMALEYAEKYGICDYKLKNNIMTYYEKHYDNGFSQKPIKYKHIMNLYTRQEIVKPLYVKGE